MHDTTLRKVLVSGIPSLLSTDVLKTYLESETVDGGAVEEIFFETGQETAVVVFKNIEGKFHKNVLTFYWRMNSWR